MPTSAAGGGVLGRHREAGEEQGAEEGDQGSQREDGADEVQRQERAEMQVPRLGRARVAQAQGTRVCRRVLTRDDIC